MLPPPGNVPASALLTLAQSSLPFQSREWEDQQRQAIEQKCDMRDLPEVSVPDGPARRRSNYFMPSAPFWHIDMIT